MGFTPQQIGAMTYWEFLACADGYALKNGAKRPINPPTQAEFKAWADELRARNRNG